MVTIKEIREIFREMFQEHETKQEGIFTKHEKLVLDLISGHQALLKQMLDQLCDSLTSVKIEVEELKESLRFTQNDIDQKFSNINEKVQSLEKELSSTKEDVRVIQTTEPTWALEIRRKLVDLEDRSRRNNLRILGIKKDPRESWEECENKIYDLLEEKLEMGKSNITIERAHRVGEKSNDKEMAIVVQFLFYKDKINILRNCKKLKGTKISIFEDFSREIMQIRKEKWKEVLANRKQGKISNISLFFTVIKLGRGALVTLLFPIISFIMFHAFFDIIFV